MYAHFRLGTLDILHISVDGRREIHDSVRGIDGTFERVVSGIKALQTQKKRCGSHKPFTFLCATVNKDNAKCLDDVFEIGEELQIDGLEVFYGYFQTEESCRLHEALMQEKRKRPVTIVFTSA